MEQIICGNLEFDNIKYKFDFRDNVLVLIPEEMQEYSKWRFYQSGKKDKFDYVNI